MSNQDDKAWIEDADSDDSFHKNLQAHLKNEGELIGIAWPAKDPKPGELCVALAVLNNKGDVATRRFSIIVSELGYSYSLKAGGKSATYQSQYFFNT